MNIAVRSSPDQLVYKEKEGKLIVEYNTRQLLADVSKNITGVTY